MDLVTLQLAKNYADAQIKGHPGALIGPPGPQGPIGIKGDEIVRSFETWVDDQRCLGIEVKHYTGSGENDYELNQFLVPYDIPREFFIEDGQIKIEKNDGTIEELGRATAGAVMLGIVGDDIPDYDTTTKKFYLGTSWFWQIQKYAKKGDYIILPNPSRQLFEITSITYMSTGPIDTLGVNWITNLDDTVSGKSGVVGFSLPFFYGDPGESLPIWPNPLVISRFDEKVNSFAMDFLNNIEIGTYLILANDVRQMYRLVDTKIGEYESWGTKVTGVIEASLEYIADLDDSARVDGPFFYLKLKDKTYRPKCYSIGTTQPEWFDPGDGNPPYLNYEYTILSEQEVDIEDKGLGLWLNQGAYKKGDYIILDNEVNSLVKLEEPLSYGTNSNGDIFFYMKGLCVAELSTPPSNNGETTTDTSNKWFYTDAWLKENYGEYPSVSSDSFDHYLPWEEIKLGDYIVDGERYIFKVTFFNKDQNEDFFVVYSLSLEYIDQFNTNSNTPDTPVIPSGGTTWYTTTETFDFGISLKQNYEFDTYYEGFQFDFSKMKPNDFVVDGNNQVYRLVSYTYSPVEETWEEEFDDDGDGEPDRWEPVTETRESYHVVLCYEFNFNGGGTSSGDPISISEIFFGYDSDTYGYPALTYNIILTDTTMQEGHIDLTTFKDAIVAEINAQYTDVSEEGQ